MENGKWKIEIMRRILMTAIGAIMAISIYAQGPARVPAYRGLIERVQPNGDTIHVYLRGDEWSHFTMTEDGWQLLENEKGWLKYAKKNRRGEVVMSCRKAHDAAKRKRCETRWLEKKGIKK